MDETLNQFILEERRRNKWLVRTYLNRFTLKMVELSSSSKETELGADLGIIIASVSSRFALPHHMRVTYTCISGTAAFLDRGINLGLVLCHVDSLILWKNWKLFIRFYFE